MLGMVKDGTHSTMQHRLRPMRQKHSLKRLDMPSMAACGCGTDSHHGHRSSAERGRHVRVGDNRDAEKY
jgi:hypothetical protein